MLLQRIKAHGVSDRTQAARSCCLGSVCSHCGVDVVTRLRALRDLVHGAGACVQACASGLLPVFDAGSVAAAN